MTRECQEKASGTRSLLPGDPAQLDDGGNVGLSFETMRMRGPDCRSLVAVVQHGMQRVVRATATDVQSSIAIVVRSSAATAQAWCEPVEHNRPRQFQIEHAQRTAQGRRADFFGQQIISGEVRAAYQRRPAEDPHQLDLLV